MRTVYQIWKALAPVVALIKKYGIVIFNKVLEAVADMEQRGDLDNDEKRRRAVAIVVFFANQIGVRVEADDVEKLIKIAIILIRLKRAANA